MHRGWWVLIGIVVVIVVVILVVLGTGTYLSVPPKKHCPPLMGSRNWRRGVEHSGNGIYHMLPTESRSLKLRRRVRGGVVWVRLGSPGHARRDAATGTLSADAYDVDRFARKWLPRLREATVLVTTDGDASVPSDLRPDTVQRILSHPNLRAWYTQNYDGTLEHPKMRRVPIGLDLQARWLGFQMTPRSRFRDIERTGRLRRADSDRIMRIWSDVHLKTYPGRHGDPRAAVRALVLGDTENRARIDAPPHRLHVRDIWERYATYAFVISVHGNGMDCHRTWEALYLGAIVITQRSPLDPLLEPWRVLFVDDWSQLRDWDWLDAERRRLIAEKPRHTLDATVWTERFKRALRE